MVLTWAYPLLLGRIKSKILIFLKERLWKRINSWNSRFLSKVVMEVLIIAQAIPTYCMSIFLIPITILNEVHMMLNGGVKKRRKERHRLACMGENVWE